MLNVPLKYFDSLINDIEQLSKKVKLLIVFLIHIMMFSLMLFYRYNNQKYDLFNLTFENFSNMLSLIHFGIIFSLLIICFIKLREISENYLTTIFFFSCFNIFLLPISQIFYEPYNLILSLTIVFSLILFCIYLCFIVFNKRRNKFIKSIFTTLIISIFILSSISIYVLTYIPDNYFVQNNNLSYDTAVIFGAAVWSKNKPSPVLRERILKALSLYRSDKVKTFVVTGGHARGELTEAQVAKNLLVEKGIDESNIIVENKTTSTAEQVRYIRDSIFIKNNYRNLILVSDNFHLRRITEMCKFNGMSPIGVSSDSPLLDDNIIFYAVRESAGLILFWYFGL
jgi:vancomycin permeability regulator SanA